MKRGLILLALLMACVACMTSAQAAGSATLYLAASDSSGHGGDEITLSMFLSADDMGGLQTEITWNTGYLTYVEGSAAFKSGFTQHAAISQVNTQDGCIRLVYGNTQGYTAQDEPVFTARFRLNENVAGWTNFELTNTKMSDASTAIDPMEVSSWGASVETAYFYAGDMWMNLNLRNDDQYSPRVGDKVEMYLSLSSSGPAIGSVQGTITYDPAVLSLLDASFTDEAEAAAVTKSLNTAAQGSLPFVYAALNGCPQAELLSLTFEVVGTGEGYTYLNIANAKATNNETSHLSTMYCWPSGLSLYPQLQSNQVSYTLSLPGNTKCSDEEVTVYLNATGVAIGGMQATLTYNPAQMAYVPGSANFLGGFAQGADVKLINDSAAGQIQLLYARSAGYQPDGSSIFTARFRLLTADEHITPVQLTGIKTTDASQTDVQVIDSSFSSSIDWRYALHTPATVAAVAPTCTATGLTEGKHCSICGTVIVAQSTVPAKGHTEVIDKAVAPTCTATGLTEGKHCSVCGAVIVAQSTVPAKGHTEVVDKAVAATCTATGLTEGKHCSVCGSVLVAQSTVPAKGHTEVVDKAVDATCTDTGLTEGKHCSVCGAVLVAQTTVPAKGHTEVIDKAVAPTCTATGLTEGKHCSVCGAVIVAQSTVPAKGHTEVVDKAVAATCTATGLTEGKHCSACGTVIVAQNTVPAKGHTEVIDKAVAATCTATGLTEGKHCSVCGSVLVAQNTVPAKGHTEVIDKAVAATCTATGLTEGKHCSACGTVIVAQNTVPAKGHTEVIDKAVAATCTATGLTEGKHCSVCGAVIVAQSTVPAKGHVWDTGVITKEPTTTEEGTKTFTCTACRTTRTESIPKVENTRLPGDADDNGFVDILDALLTLQYSVGWNVEINLSNANVDGNGSVDIMDALLILQYSVGWNVQLL